MRRIISNIISSAIFTTVFFAIKYLGKLLFILLKFLLRFIVYIGAHFPALYSLLIGCMVWSDNLDLKVKNEILVLVIVGFVLSLICNLIIFFKNVIIEPMYFLYDFKNERRLLKSEKAARRERNKQIKNPDYMPPKAYNPVYPIIYRSQVNPNIVIREYHDIYKVYREQSDGFYLIDIKRKKVLFQDRSYSSDSR